MRRLARILLNVATVFSLVLCGAAVVMWWQAQREGWSTILQWPVGVEPVRERELRVNRYRG
ncbi:MAG: hypothetical protein JWN40_3489, partial [Phycisphaerales bacterium]|nr:hypothetical protein [Phycisphaerales bacterium]